MGYVMMELHIEVMKKKKNTIYKNEFGKPDIEKR
jgi:hypothetical protein